MNDVNNTSDTNGGSTVTQSRREFLTHSAGFLAWTSIGGITALTQANPAAAQAAGLTNEDGLDYRALVCVFLVGGNDSYNMLVPLAETDGTGDLANLATHADYQTLRGTVKLNTVTGLADRDGSGVYQAAEQPHYQQFGIHPDLGYLGERFGAGEAAFVMNVGTMLPPSTESDGAEPDRPPALYSHNSQIFQWQTANLGWTNPPKPSGWVGRIGDVLDSCIADDPFKFISMAGNSVVMLGEGPEPGDPAEDCERTRPENFVATPTGSSRLNPVAETGGQTTELWKETVRELIETSSHSKFGDQYLTVFQDSLDKNEIFDSLWIGNDPAGESDIDDALGGVAAAIASARKAAIDEGHGQPVRQVFFAMHGSYDHHRGLIDGQSEKFVELNQALKTFWDGVDEDTKDDVVLFSCSEFGRTGGGNQNKGTDHGWGGNQFVMGRAAIGDKQLAGTYPNIADRNNPEIFDGGGRRRMIPTTSIEEYYTELALWLGVKTPERLEQVFETINKYWESDTVAEPTLPLGFLDPTEVDRGASVHTPTSDGIEYGPFAGGGVVEETTVSILPGATIKPLHEDHGTIEVADNGAFVFQATQTSNRNVVIDIDPGPQLVLPPDATSLTLIVQSPADQLYCQARNGTRGHQLGYLTENGGDLGDGWRRIVFTTRNAVLGADTVFQLVLGLDHDVDTPIRVSHFLVDEPDFVPDF